MKNRSQRSINAFTFWFYSVYALDRSKPILIHQESRLCCRQSYVKPAYTVPLTLIFFSNLTRVPDDFNNRKLMTHALLWILHAIALTEVSVFGIIKISCSYVFFGNFIYCMKDAANHTKNYWKTIRVPMRVSSTYWFSHRVCVIDDSNIGIKHKRTKSRDMNPF